jgi:small-conductance mechanosensitive channel
VADIFGIDLNVILNVLVIAAVAIALERIFTIYLSRFAKRIKMQRSSSNNLVLTFRMLILIGALLAISRVGGLQPEWIVSFSAIGGAALGFASQKTIGNFIAGLYLLAARPFTIEDYVRIGTVEGIVQEITINYTKLLTIGNNIVSISNLQILDRDITNYTLQKAKHLDLYCYTFEIGFDHSVTEEKIAKIFDAVFERCSHNLPRKPSYMLMRSSAFDRVYAVFLYVERPEDIFTLRPLIAEQVIRLWDIERAKPNQI